MCGGVGSRFWPYSREHMPKQFIDFFGTGQSLLQMTVERLSAIVPRENIILMTNELYADIIREQLPDIKPDRILLEPARRNTAPCVAWAAWHIAALNSNATVMVAPSDHLILKPTAYADAVRAAFDFVDGHRNALLTLGINPSRPETGYGYIQAGEVICDNFHRVKTFTEKPNEELARVFVGSGEFFWNSGMFFWSVQAIIDAMREYAPDVALVMDRGGEMMGTAAEQHYIDVNYEACPNISIDYAVMEKAREVCVQTVDFGWSDLGTWGALYDVSPKDRDANVLHGTRAVLHDCHDNIVAVRGEKLIIAAGLHDYIIADTPDALLIIPKDEEQKLRIYVNDVRSKFGSRFS